MPTNINLENAVRRALDLNVKFYSDLTRLGVDYIRDISSALGDMRPEVGGESHERPREGARADAPAARVLVLDGAADSHAAAEFVITNHLSTVVSTHIVTTPFVDATGHVADVDLVFEPDEIELQPREQVVVRVKTRITDAMHPGASYRGELSVPDLGGAGIPVVVRRRRDAG
jgi:hypothetical protein